MTPTSAGAGRWRNAWWRWLYLAAVAAMCVALQALPRLPEALQALEHVAQDALRRAGASHQPDARVLVVDIDEPSLAAAGPWPWPRSRMADLAEALLGAYGARAVGFDVVFPSPADAAGDARLAALGRLAPVAFAQVLDFARRPVPLHVGVAQAPALPALPVATAGATSGAPARGFVANHRGLAGVRCVGNIGIVPDADGRIRRMPLISRLDGQPVALLPLALLLCPGAKGEAQAQRALATLARDGADWAAWELPFQRWDASYDVVPAAAILNGHAPAELVRGRWVLVGSSALGLNDRVATPLAASTAGVMVHAAALSALLDRAAVAPALPAWAGRWLAAGWTLLWLVFAGWTLARRRAWALVVGGLVASALWWLLAQALLRQQLSAVAIGPLAACLLVLCYGCVELWWAQRDQSRLLRSFSSYVAPAVVQEMLRRGIERPMQPSHADITVVSADMQNYSGHMAGAALAQAADLTTEFLHCLTQPVLAQGGTLDKYTGDGLVAFWGAPLPRPDHAQQALQAAVGMVQAVQQWNVQRTEKGLPPVRVRVGVESGRALVGDLGTRFRSTYTAVGDCINQASKLQAMAKTLPFDLVVGPAAAAASGDARLQPVADVQLPGFNSRSVLWSVPSVRSVPS